MPPSCSSRVYDESACDGGRGFGVRSPSEPCQGKFSLNTMFPVQEGQVVLINYTVTGEQRFYDYWSKTAPFLGYNVRCVKFV